MHLNINLLTNKFEGLQEISQNELIDILCIDESKHGDSLPDGQFKGYQFPPFRCDRKNTGQVVGKQFFLKKRLL